MNIVEHRRSEPRTDFSEVPLAMSAQRSGLHAAVQVSGPFTSAVGDRLNEMLEWLFDAGARDVLVEFEKPADPRQYSGPPSRDVRNPLAASA